MDSNVYGSSVSGGSQRRRRRPFHTSHSDYDTDNSLHYVVWIAIIIFAVAISIIQANLSDRIDKLEEGAHTHQKESK